MKQVEVYTDGACSGNPGPGGWGAVLRYRFNGKVYEKSSAAATAATNNRMELTAFIEALRQLKEPCEVRLLRQPVRHQQRLEKAGPGRGSAGAGKSPTAPCPEPRPLGVRPWSRGPATSSPTSGSKAMQATRRTNAATSLRVAQSREHMAGDRDDERCFSARERV